MNYNKPTKTIEIRTKSSFSVSDPTASMALSEFEAKDTMGIPTLIPFHAVDHIEVTTEVKSATRPDPYGCEEEGSNKVCEGKVCGMKVEC